MGCGASSVVNNESVGKNDHQQQQQQQQQHQQQQRSESSSSSSSSHCSGQGRGMFGELVNEAASVLEEGGWRVKMSGEQSLAIELEVHTRLTLLQKNDNLCEQDECILCLENYLPGDQLRVLGCSHAFHASCIDDWLHRSRSCPICCQSIIRAKVLRPCPSFTFHDPQECTDSDS